ncbi:MAG: MarR family transcriptional regulator [Candidatus Freyarchaeota archaeon]
MMLMAVATQMVKFQEEVKGEELPPSALEVINILRKEGPLTPKELFEKTTFAPRTVRYALKILLDRKLVKKVPNLNDLRQNKYVALG